MADDATPSVADATVTVPDTSTANPSDTVAVIDPALVDPSITTANAAAAMDAQAQAADSLSPADFAQAKAALVQLILNGDQSDTTAAAIATSAGHVSLASSHTVRITIYRWELEAIAWYHIGAGTVVAAVGAFFDFPGVGIPLGAIFNAIGLGTTFSGSFLLWWADSHFPDHRTYTISW